MWTRSLSLVFLLAFGALALDWVGSLTSFAVYQKATGNAEAVKIYQACVEKTNSGVVTSTTAECIGRILAYMVTAGAFTVAGGTITESVTSGYLNALLDKITGRDDGQHSGAYIDSLLSGASHNASQAAMAYGYNITYTGVSDSPYFPGVGVALHTNIVAAGNPVSIHTNGTSFKIHVGESTNQTAIYKRDLLDTASHYYEFGDVKGIKLEAHLANTPANLANAAGELMGNAQLFGADEYFHGSDAWYYSVCNAANTVGYFYGIIVVEAGGFGSNWESIPSIACGSGKPQR